MKYSIKKRLLALGLTGILATTVQAAPATWQVEKGQSLSRIVRQLLPDDPSGRSALMRAIVELNPHAFRNADPGRMYAGVTLTLPDSKLAIGSRTAAKPMKPKTSAKPQKEISSSRAKLAAQRARIDKANQATTAAKPAAGRVVYAKGQATAATTGGEIRPLVKGEDVFDGDTLNTGPGSFLRLLYSDGATMVLRPRSRLQLEDYKHSGDTSSDRNLMRLVKGGFRTVTGAIGNANKDAYLVATPVATIGIRGTDYSAVFCAGDCINMPDGLYTTTEVGSTVVTSGGQAEVVDTGNSVYVPIAGGVPQPLRIKPRILALPDPGCE
jgi:hypothetical protein